MERKNVIIAIDGYSSCGKSTVAKALAKRLNYVYIDSGAMYRAFTLYLIESQIDVADIEKIKSALPDVHIEFRVEDEKCLVILNNRDVTDMIRDMRVSELVSEVSSITEVRSEMVAQQQRMGKDRNIVMDGRDIGTTVFPDAQVKIFMVADPKVRAERRYQELKRSGKNNTFEEIFENIAHRDFQDTTRKVSPLIRSKEAVVLDNTELSEEQQLDFVINKIRNVIKCEQ